MQSPFLLVCYVIIWFCLMGYIIKIIAYKKKIIFQFCDVIDVMIVKNPLY